MTKDPKALPGHSVGCYARLPGALLENWNLQHPLFAFISYALIRLRQIL
jgi:hypothetical protein